MSLVENLNQFKGLSIVPMDLDVEKLDEGIGIQETLMIHSAKWHKTCSLKFNKQALQRVSRKQTKQRSQNAGTSGVQTRSAFSHTIALDLCFFCNEPAGTTNLHEASTHKLDMKVRRCALQLEDRKLLGKLSAGDMIALETKYHWNCLRIHSTRLKIRLLSALPDLTAHVQGREILLTFKEDIGLALIKASDGDSDAVHLMRAAHVIRKELLNIKIKQFDGFFTSECQRDSVPSSLLALVNMIQDGPNIKHQTQLASNASTTAALSVSQLVVFNSVKQSRNSKPSVNVRHDRDHETPIPLYLGLKVHAVTRSKTLVDTLFHLGLCTSYDRVLQIQSDIANGVCQRYEMEKVVCPPNMRRGLFTIAAVDNIDHNPSSATAKDYFHGTGISLMQH